MLRRCTKPVLVAAVVSCLTTTVTTAQTYTDASYQPYPTGAQPSVSYPLGPPNAPQFHASTLQEGVLRGTASVMQAYYNGQLTLAQARILLAEARTREAQYVVNLTAFAQERRRLIASEREQLRQKQLETNLLGKQLHMARMPLRYAEYQLEPDEFDPQTGEIRWPAALSHKRFDKSTIELDELFFELASADRSDARFLQTRIDDACQQLQQELRDARDQLKLDRKQYENYLACQRFILGLKYEAKCGGFGGSIFSLAAQ